jgi:Ca-activated chloride channel family protein
MTLKFRYKPIDSEKSILVETPVIDKKVALNASSENFRFSASVAAFGMVLRDSKFKGTATFDLAKSLAEGAKLSDPEGYRADYIKLIDQAKALKK